jgi:hypothetical protein
MEKKKKKKNIHNELCSPKTDDFKKKSHKNGSLILADRWEIQEVSLSEKMITCCGVMHQSDVRTFLILEKQFWLHNNSKLVIEKTSQKGAWTEWTSCSHSHSQRH